MTIQTVQFHNQEIQVLNYEGKPYVAMKPIVENIGLDWASQYRRIKNHAVLTLGVVMMTIPSKGGGQEVLCLPLGMLNGWIFGIDTKRVKPEIRDVLRLYQLECYDVLYNHFLPEVAAVHPNTIDSEQQHEIKSLVNEVSRKTGIHYQGVYTRLYEKFKIPRYQELPVRDYQQAIEFLSSLVTRTPRDDKNFKEQAFIVGIMRAGIKRRHETSRALDLLESQLMDAINAVKDEMKKVYEIGRKIRHVNQSMGIIHDAITESYIRLQFDKSVYKEEKRWLKNYLSH